MAFTYNSSNIGTSGITTVRFLIGDTSSGQNTGLGLPNLLTDADIEGSLTLFGNNYLAAARCCDVLAARHATQVTVRNEGLTINASDRRQAYLAMAQQLRSDAALSAVPYSGGRSISEKDDRAADSDLVQPSFAKGQDDYLSILATSNST